MIGFTFPACPLPPGAAVWAYLRDSGGETQDLASQRAYVLAYCEHHRLSLVRLFEDSAISAGSVAGREEFELMIELGRLSTSPTVDGILYWDIKRFARNQLDSQFYKADLRRRGYKLISLSDDIPDSEFSIVFEAFLEWKAEKDRSDIAKDTKRGLAFIVGMKDDQGNYIGLAPGKPPKCFIGQPYDTGLIRNNGRPRIVQRWVPDPATWEKGKMAWEMRARRASYDEIERETGLYANPANPASSYNFFFQNQIYTGRFIYSGKVYDNFVPALATPEQWEAVQNLRYHRPVKGEQFPIGKLHPKTGRSTFLLSGLCTCMYCQSNVHASQNRQVARGREWPHYVCSRKKARPADCQAKQIPAHKLETAVVQAVVGKILTMDFLQDLIDQINVILSDTDAVEQKIAEQQKKLISLDRVISNLLDLAEQYGPTSVIDRFRQREMERDTARRELHRLQSQLKQRVTVDPAVVVSILSDMRLNLLGREIAARQMVLRQTLEKIEVGRTKARLYYRFPLYLFEVGDYYMPSTGFELKYNFDILL